MGSRRRRGREVIAAGSTTNIGEGGYYDTREETKTLFSTSSGSNQMAQRLEVPTEFRSGWLTQMAARVWGRSQDIDGRLVMWEDDAEGGDLLIRSPQQRWEAGGTTYGVWQRYFPSPSSTARIEAGKRYWVGWWTPSNRDRYYRVYDFESISFDGRGQTRQTQVAENWTGWSPEGGILAVDFFYQQNANPSRGEWQSPSPGQVFNSSEPVFQGYIRHDNGDEEFDYTRLVHVQIWREDTGTMLYDREFEPSDTERQNKRFSRVLTALPTGINLKARFRHQDSWQVWTTDWSKTYTFQCARGPAKPDLTSPKGRLNQLSGYTYQGVYTHELNRQSNAIQIRLLSATGQQIYDSGVVAKTVNAGASWTHSVWHPALQWGTNYIWEAKFRSRNDTNTGDVWGPASQVAFKTNSVPYKPSDLVPSGSIQSGKTLLTATVRDPDNDTITAGQAELYNITTATNVTLTNLPTIVSGQLRLNAAPDLVPDNQYRWRVRATDGIVYGDWSDWATFTFRAAPIVDWVFPTNDFVRNQVRDPSYEHGDVSEFWSEVARVEDFDYRVMVDDGDAAFGFRSWRATESATSAHEEVSDPIPVDPTKPFLAYTHGKKESGTTRTNFIVECLNSSGTVLPGGTFKPSYSPAGLAALDFTDMPLTWTPFGGLVWPVGSSNSPAMPANTTQVRLRVGYSIASEAVLRIDGFFWTQPPNVSAAEMPDHVKWYGYFDGDTEPFDTTPGAPGYTWTGTPGDSPSAGLHIARDGNLSVYISYAHPTRSQTSKTGHKRVINEKVGDEWVTVFRDTAFVGGNVTKIPLPTGILKGDRRYEINIEVVDDVTITSSVPPLYVDVRPEGPPELNIIIARADNDQAQVRIVHDPSTEGISDFAGIEIAKGPNKVIVDRVPDPTQTEWVDHFPVPGRMEEYWVRQLRLKDTDEIPSRWDRAEVQADFLDFWIKEVENPSAVALPFIVLSRDAPTSTFGAPIDSYRPWGEPDPVHIVGAGRENSGSLVVRLLDETPEVLDRQLSVIDSLIEHRKTVGLISHRPARVRFVQLLSFDETAGHLYEHAAYTISWERTSYSENYYERTGLYP